jgi:DeoR/GlpR family transcriptional regulator of sugar metabolism
VTQLQREVRVSRSTLRRDLVELERAGDVVRVHGGVVHRDYLQGEPTFDRRGRQAVAAKGAIAAAAAAMVPDNAAVYLDAGTTCAAVGRHVLLRPDAKVFTHSLRLAADAASTDAPAALVLVGGEVRKVSQAVVGGLALRWLEHLQFDVAFVAASGVSAEGVSTTELTEAAVKQAVISRAAKAVLVADAGKWDRPAAVRFAGWEQFGAWVVDSAVPKAARAAAEAAGVRVIVAKEGQR